MQQPHTKIKSQGGEIVTVYAVITTILAAVFLIGYIKYKITAVAMTYFVGNKYSLPTDKELEECTTAVIKHWFGKD